MTRITVTIPGVVFDNELFSDGWQLSNLEGWWGSTDPRLGSDPRPDWHGDFGSGDVFLSPRFVTVSGVFQSYGDPVAVHSAVDALTSLHQLGKFVLAVDDGTALSVNVEMASRVSWDVDYAPGCAAFEFTVKADDPRRFLPLMSVATGVPTSGVGVADPLTDPVSEGAPGGTGVVSVSNGGNAPTEPVFVVAGGLSEGFELRHVDTGRVVRVTRPILDGSVVRVDMGAGMVWIDGVSPVSAEFVPVAEWFQVPPRSSASFMFSPLGVQTGTPSMTVECAGASW